MYGKKIIFLLVLSSCLAFCDGDKGKEIFNEASCLGCHNLEDFGDKKTKVKFFKQLESRVQACQIAGNDALFDDEVHSIAEYLNKDYYKLKK